MYCNCKLLGLMPLITCSIAIDDCCDIAIGYSLHDVGFDIRTMYMYT